MNVIPRLEPGTAYPLGACWDGKGVNFTLFSAHAERVELCLFDTSGQRELYRLPLGENTDEIWHGYLRGFGPGTVYGYRVYGEYRPRSGHRFNHHKLLLDPYARCLVGRFAWTDAHYAYRLDDPRGDLSFDARDNAASMYKAMVVDEQFDWGNSRKPATSWPDTFIYEAHVRGLTIRHPDVPRSLAGSFGGLAQPCVIDHIRSLGVSAIELLPVHAFVDEHFLHRRELVNYWGYNSLGFCAPMPRYMSTEVPGAPQLDELKAAVKAYHDAGLEVILDVVYNHTAEGNELGPTFSFKGIDNLSYYHLSSNNHRFYEDFTGCGNSLNLSHPRVAALVLDSLRYWAEQVQVDGFRFDLASTLARDPHAFDTGASFLDSVRQDPVLARCKLIAEPWDLGPGGYQLGGFPAGWCEWNDQFRDTVRRFWRRDEAQLPLLAKRLHGSSDLFEHHGRRPHSSLNYVTSHDGFTLLDQLSYLHKHNEANGEANRDGHTENFSENFDVEGETDDVEVNRTRDRQRRNLLATLMFAEGTPMLLAGDELGRSQKGNNNAYCQDNELTWVDWSGRDSRLDLVDFVARLASIRRNSSVLRRDRFVHGEFCSRQTDFADIGWYTSGGNLMTEADWTNPGNRCLGMLRAGDAPRFDRQWSEIESGIGGRSGAEPVGEPGGDGEPPLPPHTSESADTEDTILVIFNAGLAPVQFTLPAPSRLSADTPSPSWCCLLNTANEHSDGAWRRDGPVAAGPLVTVDARSVLVLGLTP